MRYLIKESDIDKNQANKIGFNEINSMINSFHSNLEII